MYLIFIQFKLFNWNCNDLLYNKTDKYIFLLYIITFLYTGFLIYLLQERINKLYK